MKERIKKIRKENHFTQQEFAEYLGVSKSNVESYELGRRAPSDAFISLFCSKLNVSEEWIRTGEGEPYTPQTMNQQIADFINRVMADKDDAFRKRYINHLSNMTDEGWLRLEQYLDDLKNI